MSPEIFHIIRYVITERGSYKRKKLLYMWIIIIKSIYTIHIYVWGKKRKKEDGGDDDDDDDDDDDSVVSIIREETRG